MASSLSKKFALLCCCLMTMQALRLVISTAGFCVVRFHIDCSLFNIFISRLVNAVMMSQLFGNWLGDIIVFAADGKWKLIGLMLANWVEFACFVSALICICHTECGHLTGFYWSMVSAYFWWKVGEAPCTSIGAPDAVDYYFAGFTLSGVWGACLKGLVMRCVSDGAKSQHFRSDALGEVNVTLVGTRSVKTTVDYRAAKWLFLIVIVLTALMCLPWSIAAVGVYYKGGDKTIVVDEVEAKVKDAIGKKADGNAGNASDNTFKDALMKATGVKWTGGSTTVDWTNASVQDSGVQKQQEQGQVTIQVTGLSGGQDGELTGATYELDGVIRTVAGAGVNPSVAGEGKSSKTQVTLTVTLKDAGVLDDIVNQVTAAFAGAAFGGLLAVPGALLGAGVGWVFAACFKCCLPAARYAAFTKWCQLIFGIVGAAGGMAAGAAPCVLHSQGQLGMNKDWEKRVWVEALKWPQTNEDKEGHVKLAALIGLAAGLAAGALLGLCIGCCTNAKKSGFFAGALVGSFLGLWAGEIANGCLTWLAGDKGIVSCGFLIVVLGLGTVYSIYPGMAPCSITQFRYFNIIDILILFLSSIAPIVIMGLDLKDDPNRLSTSILNPTKTFSKVTWVSFGVLLLIATLICEIVVLDIMQHPFSKMAKTVTTSPSLAVLLTVTMVTSQLVSSGVGFGCVAAGSTFNDGINNVLSTLVLWTIECCGVLGEGYLTELKKYEPGKWPTQGMGKWDTYSWWNRKAFGNAWQIWCCIGTTDLRRDIMLCKQ